MHNAPTQRNINTPAPAAKTNSTIPALTVVPSDDLVLVVEFVSADVMLGLSVELAALAVTDVPFLQVEKSGVVAVEEKVMSAHRDGY